jgi:hypothetical protein
MIVALFRRRLRKGASFEDFLAAWEADKGFGVPTRVFNAVSFEDPREILSVGFVDVDAGQFGAEVAGVADQEAVRHSRIAEVTEATMVRMFFDLRREHDLTGDPREIDPGSPESLLAALRGVGDGQQ